MNVFEFVKAINNTKVDLFEDPQSEKEYIPFIVNKSLSYFPDTVLFANEINKFSNIPKRLQFDFYRYAIPKRNRYSKWVKKESVTEDLKLIMEYYNYSAETANSAIKLLSKEEIQQIKDKLFKGGKITTT